MTGQLGPLIVLRWRMVRSPWVRVGFASLAGAVLGISALAVLVGIVAPRDPAAEVLLLAPTALLGVLVVAIAAPLAAGGGNDLFPEDQIVAYPITARTQYAMALALTPLNLAWTTQLVVLLGLTSYVSERQTGLPLALVTCLAYVALATTAGQAVAWMVIGVRHRAWGRRLTWGLAVGLVPVGAAVVLGGHTGAVLDQSPTTWVVIGALDGASQAYGDWFIVTAILLMGTAVAAVAGRHACAWSLRQPDDVGGRIDSRTVRRRRGGRGPLGELIAVDRASMWRSAPLRRGLLVLSVLPGLVAAIAALDWPSLVLLPGLVAAGTGLLFGVNAFCLDGSGAVWLASLPRPPWVPFWAKAQVIFEVCCVAVGLTVLAGSSRAGRPPIPAEIAALTACSVVTILRVVAVCMQLSVTRPHRADLRGPRDAPAPPGVMATYSVRLAVSTTLVAVLFSATSQARDWRLPALLAVPFVLLSIRRLLISAAAWADPATRARVATTVASG